MKTRLLVSLSLLLTAAHPVFAQSPHHGDAGVEATLDSMTQALAAAAIDQAAVARFSQTAGTKSCQGCHLVHMPAAYSPLAAH